LGTVALRAKVAAPAWSVLSSEATACRGWQQRDVYRNVARSAASTRSGVKGTCRSRTPVASNTALPIAVATTVIHRSVFHPALGREVAHALRAGALHRSTAMG